MPARDKVGAARAFCPSFGERVLAYFRRFPQVASSLNAGTTTDQASWTNTGASATDVYVHVYRYSSTRTTYQLRVSY